MKKINIKENRLRSDRKRPYKGVLTKAKKKLKTGPITHGASANGKLTGCYKTWLAMKRRCTDPKSKDYKHYKNRNITLDNNWLKFENFLKDMGERPPNTSIDRIDNNKGYYKENCRWASRKIQGGNTSRCRYITFNGKTQTVTTWAKEIGIDRATLSARLNLLKWPIEKVLEKRKCQNQYK